MDYRIRPALRFRGRWPAAGDKSITHRALLCGALAEGDTELSNANRGEDCARTRALVEALGVQVEDLGRGRLRLTGRGGRFRAPAGPLDAGGSATTLRLAAGLLAAQPFETVLDGDATLRRRPMARVAEPLAALGARVILADGGTPPLRVQGGVLRGAAVASPVASGQVKTAFLLAALQAAGESRFTEPRPSRDHGERLLARMGAVIARDGEALVLAGPQALRGASLAIPGDLSAAAFLLGAALLVEGGSVVVRGVGVNPTRDGFLRVVERMGGRLAAYHPREEAGEPVADLLAQHSRLRAVEVAPDDVPSLIDELPLLALLATRATGTSRFHGLGELRVKESDRLAGTAELIAAFGGRARVEADSLVVEGGRPLRGAEVDPRGDHRLAMAATVLGLAVRGRTVVRGAECAAASFPEFFSLARRFSGGALTQAAAEGA
jgi:3-phosphoshikimate 1-carboxyvinyltransferase